MDLELQPKEQTTYKCESCYEIYEQQYEAFECIFKHARQNYANALLEEGRSLSSINYLCGYNWILTDEQKDVTKDNCFIMSHWQLCEKPAYRIWSIEETGKLKLGGHGGGHGVYSDIIDIKRLPKSHPKSELYSYAETKAKRGF